MARKTIRVSDRSGEEIAEGKGATVRSRSRTRVRVCASSISQTRKPRRWEVVRSLAVDEDRKVRARTIAMPAGQLRWVFPATTTQLL